MIRIGAALALLVVGCGGPEFTTAPSTATPLALEGRDAGGAADDAMAPADAETPDAAPAPMTPDAGTDARAPEAGPPPSSALLKCLASCSTGCCDTSGACHVGNTDAICGTRASRADGMCQNCNASGYCNAAFECQSGTRPPVCGPNTCGGCCDSSGSCVVGTADTLCGKAGVACGDCASAGKVCTQSGCQAFPDDSCDHTVCIGCGSGLSNNLVPCCKSDGDGGSTCSCASNGVCL